MARRMSQKNVLMYVVIALVVVGVLIAGVALIMKKNEGFDRSSTKVGPFRIKFNPDRSIPMMGEGRSLIAQLDQAPVMNAMQLYNAMKVPANARYARDLLMASYLQVEAQEGGYHSMGSSLEQWTLSGLWDDVKTFFGDDKPKPPAIKCVYKCFWGFMFRKCSDKNKWSWIGGCPLINLSNPSK